MGRASPVVALAALVVFVAALGAHGLQTNNGLIRSRRVVRHAETTTTADADLVSRRLRAQSGQMIKVGVRFDPPAAAPGLDFMQGIMVLGGSEKLREAGAACVACSSLKTLRAVADEQAGSDDQCVVLYAGGDDSLAEAAEAGANAALVRVDDAASIEEARALGLAPFGLVSSEDIDHAATMQLAALVIEMGGAIEPLPKRKQDSPVILRVIGGGDDETVDAMAHTCRAAGYDGVLILDDQPATWRRDNPAELAESIAKTLKLVRSKRSRTFGGFLGAPADPSEAPTETEQAWAKFVYNAQEAGVMEQFASEDAEATADLNKDTGDYKTF